MRDPTNASFGARSQPSRHTSRVGQTVLFMMGLLIVLGIEMWAITVSVSEFSLVGDPGGWIADAFVIFNGEPQAVDVEIEVVDWDRALDGITRTYEISTLERSCASWMSVSSVTATLAPNAEIEIPLDIRVPEGVQGTYWAGMLITASATGVSVDEGDIKLSRQFLVRVFVTVLPTTSAGRVSNLQVLGINPLGIVMEFANIGDTFLSNVSGLIAVESSAGIALFEIPLIPFDVLPGYSQSQTVFGEWGLQAAGLYLIRAVLDYGAEYLVAGQSVLRINELHLIPIGTASLPPTDLNGDGLYEDVNGDGTLT
jgi:hypothetical protein